jgi:hypothetical protein
MYVRQNNNIPETMIILVFAMGILILWSITMPLIYIDKIKLHKSNPGFSLQIGLKIFTNIFFITMNAGFKKIYILTMAGLIRWINLLPIFLHLFKKGSMSL